MGTTKRTGHHRLPDGSLLRVDVEFGRWVGRLYTPDMRVRTQVVGTDTEVYAWVDGFVAYRWLNPRPAHAVSIGV